MTDGNVMTRKSKNQKHRLKTLRTLDICCVVISLPSETVMSQYSASGVSSNGRAAHTMVFNISPRKINEAGS